jgi:hypothetical protein
VDNLNPESQPFISGRGELFCRGCLGIDLFSALNLGELPIANELITSPSANTETFQLHLRICNSCGLGQVADVVTPDRIFTDYRYLSSTSTTFLKHASDMVENEILSGNVTSEDWVLEIASNDGYLLKNFLKNGIRAIGIEPAQNVAEISRSLGIETISEFFSSRLAQEILLKHGYPKLIIANNVLAHVPDLMDFVKGLSILCGPKTRISVENPSLTNILTKMQFDTIYHEHYSYLSAVAVQKIGKVHGLHLSRVEEIPTHGGSNRYILTKFLSDSNVDSSVAKIVQYEIALKLFTQDTWATYTQKVNKILENFSDWLEYKDELGSKIYGYGAAAKASTLLNSIPSKGKSILKIADASAEKQERFMPSHGIQIISPSTLFESSPTDIIIFPWNIKNEIAEFLRLHLGTQVHLWCAIPEMHELEVS